MAAVKKPRPAFEGTLTNPLHSLSSYTYSFALWWVDIDECNDLFSRVDVKEAQTWKFGPGSFVIAEDGGQQPAKRLPGSLGLNYQIQDVKFNTVLTGQGHYGSNMTSGTMTIIEPMGCSLIETLISASWDGEKFNNYTEQPFILELKFHGYNDYGEQVEDELKSNLFRKRFPVRLTTWKMNFSTKGTEYVVNFVPLTHLLQGHEYGTTPCQINVKDITTVQDFFAKFETQLNNYYKSTNNAYSDNYHFVIDKAIAESAIVYDKENSLKDKSSGATSLNINSTGFAIEPGTSIMLIVSKILSHAKFFHDQLLVMPSYQKQPGEIDSVYQARIDAAIKQIMGNQGEAFNAFKTTVKVRYGGSNVQSKVVDPKRNTRPKIIDIVISQYVSWVGNHPAVGQLADMRPYAIKNYKYLYTGQNIDIINLNINFDATYYQNIITSPSLLAAYSDSPNDSTDLAAAGPSLYLTPQLLALFYPALKIPSVSQGKFHQTLNDYSKTLGFNITNSPNAIKTIDVFKNSIYSGMTGSALTTKMTIVGDPTLIKQDDWLYVPNPNGTEYSDWKSPLDFVQEFGHYQFDIMNAVVKLTINSVLDYDVDIPGTSRSGGTYPEAARSESLFSGYYYITTVVNRFSNGKFEQDLTLARYVNGDFAIAATDTTSSRANGANFLAAINTNILSRITGQNTTGVFGAIQNGSARIS